MDRDEICCLSCLTEAITSTIAIGPTPINTAANNHISPIDFSDGSSGQSERCHERERRGKFQMFSLFIISNLDSDQLMQPMTSKNPIAG